MLVHAPHDATRFVVRPTGGPDATREKYAPMLKQFQARWTPKLKDGPGWLIYLSFKPRVVEFIVNLCKEEKIAMMESSQHPSHKEQKRYHRAVSDDEKDDYEEALDAYCKLLTTEVEDIDDPLMEEKREEEEEAAVKEERTKDTTESRDFAEYNPLL